MTSYYRQWVRVGVVLGTPVRPSVCQPIRPSVCLFARVSVKYDNMYICSTLNKQSTFKICEQILFV